MRFKLLKNEAMNVKEESLLFKHKYKLEGYLSI